MADTKSGRDEQAHDEEKRQRERDMEDELEHAEEGEQRREEHEDEEAESELADDE